jgi:hypothetical protein
VFLFASSLTPWLGFLGLVATVVVATQVEDAVVALTVVVVVLTIYLVVTAPKQRFEQRALFWRYLAEAVYEASHNLEHIAKVFTAAGQLQRWRDLTWLRTSSSTACASSPPPGARVSGTPDPT